MVTLELLAMVTEEMLRRNIYAALSDDRFIGSCEMCPKGSMLRKDSSAFGIFDVSITVTGMLVILGGKKARTEARKGYDGFLVLELFDSLIKVC